MINRVFYHALTVNPETCMGCTHCMKSCPTEAIRVVNGRAEIDLQRCIDCGYCLRSCPTKAIYLKQDDIDQMKSFKYRVILFPSVFIGQFADKYKEQQIYSALHKIGFTHIYEVEQPIQLLIDSVKEYCKNDPANVPHISSFCPAVVKLIQLKYPSLIDNVIPRKAPHDLAAHLAVQKLEKEGATREEIGLFYVTPCCAKISAVKTPVAERESIVDGILNMNELYNRVMKVIDTVQPEDTSLQRKHLTSDGMLWSLTHGESIHFGKGSMAVDGIHNVIKFLERIENDEIHDVNFLEMRACDQSCAGGILMTGNRFMTVSRLEQRALNYPETKDVNLSELSIDTEELTKKLNSDRMFPKPFYRFGSDRAKAIEKMNRASRIVCFLPGIDCGACGAPNCHALAEDMVNGKAKMSDCVFLQQLWQHEGKIKPSKAFRNMEKKWGNNRFEADCNKRGKRNEGF